jgi:tRNA dimethylallyltransferase
MMSADPFRNALILTGPTGAGKTALGFELAERLGAEIVVMDSMTLYRGMDIGTAKPTVAERRRVPHHLIDVLDPWEGASVAWWRQRAVDCCRDIEERGMQALFVGGTPLYLKALMHGLFDGPGSDPALRQRLAEEAGRIGGHALHARLAQVDPVSAERLHPNDVRRIIRALEVWETTGRPLSAWQTQWQAQDTQREGDGAVVTCSPRCLWLELPRAELYRRIDSRVLQMFADGLVDEARRLRSLARPIGREAGQALGYKEVFRYLDGQLSLAETVALVQTRSRNFAKRQMTWFRALPECRPVSRELTFLLWERRMRS